ncbi:MAG: hypothetical protein Q4D62_04875 [Planctomycetia bacterium]|nr:hypothetical protein [Planctomycetia bacterium]
MADAQFSYRNSGGELPPLGSSVSYPNETVLSDTAIPVGQSFSQPTVTEVVDTPFAQAAAATPSVPAPANVVTDAAVTTSILTPSPTPVVTEHSSLATYPEYVSSDVLTTGDTSFETGSGLASNVYANGMATTPGYPRNTYDNSLPDAPSSPELTREYPTDKHGMVPERVGQNPPLKPYPQQEGYSYFTNSATSNSTVCQHCGEGYGNPYLWMIDVQAKIRHRSREEKAPMIGYNTSSGQMVDANTNFVISAGLEFGLTRYLGRNRFNYDIWMDLRFDGLYNWNESENFLSQGGIFDTIYNGLVPGLGAWQYDVTQEDGTTKSYTSYCTAMSHDYKVQMNTGEVMFQFRERGRPDPLVGKPNGRWVRECQPGLRYTHMLGFRYTSYNEDLGWQGMGSQYDEEGETFTGVTDYLGRADIECNNNLVGLSLGGEMVDKHCVWSWGFQWRATPFLNFIDTSLRETSSSGLYHYLSEDKTDVSFQVDLGIFARYKIRPHMILSIGYDISYLGNLAVASQNGTFGTNGELDIDNRSYLILQSFSIGGTFVW